MSHLESNSTGRYVYWRVEGSLLELTTVRPVAFFTWNAQTFSERWFRRGAVLLMAALRPILYVINRRLATRVVYSILRGISRDRLDLLGDEYFHYKLRPRLRADGVAQLKQLVETGARVVLVSQSLENVMRPLAEYLGVKWIISNRLDFRDGISTGRLLDPVIRPRGIFARISSSGPDGVRSRERLAHDLGSPPEVLEQAVAPAGRIVHQTRRPIVRFDGVRQGPPLSVRERFRGKHILLAGVTGFIGKVWLVNTLMDLADVGCIYLLIRRQKSSSARLRFEKLVEESRVFDPLYERFDSGLVEFLNERVQVVEGDVSLAHLGLDPGTHERLRAKLDLVINSSGLTDFNPDLRDALSANVDAAMNVLEFVRLSDHAGLVHLSTCYAAGTCDGRVSEKARPDYTPIGAPDFDAELEWRALKRRIREIEAEAEGPETTEELRAQALSREHAAKDLRGAALENQIRKNRVRWLRNRLTEAGKRRARELGWPNTYTFTKSLAESLLVKLGAGVPIAIVRPAIVESSIRQPFRGWNEGINTSASLSYLLGTFFRQLPTNERKRLDIIPVDAVARGMTLIAAAVFERRHDQVYQLATSVTNPCDMRRSIELTSLAHRKHYRALESMESWLRLRFDAIPVSKERYNRMSAPAQRAIIKSIQRIAAPLPLRKAPLARADRNLERVEKLIELFEPFILLNEHDFVAENVEKLSCALVSEEQTAFGYDTASIDWWDYWINIHIPALRKWTYPLIEGRPLEAHPARNLHAANGNGEQETMTTGANERTWRYS
ncbi:MAG: SDR family oxidoreductase [Acidobacteria bacterium]|nr:SDR family oxidoreductase [Acidobacteriota bacterium]